MHCRPNFQRRATLRLAAWLAVACSLIASAASPLPPSPAFAAQPASPLRLPPPPSRPLRAASRITDPSGEITALPVVALEPIPAYELEAEGELEPIAAPSHEPTVDPFENDLAADDAAEMLFGGKPEWQRLLPAEHTFVDPLIASCDDCCRSWGVDTIVRGYYQNDQRIEWTGLEATFGAEAAIAPVIRRQFDDWDTAVIGDFYLNQRYDKNILVNTVERRSFRANFEPNVFEISNLFLTASRGDWTFALGKFETPFGRRYFELFSNDRHDAPFLRTEAVDWRETGFLVHYERGWFVGDAALVNGAEDRDTNSSKGIVSRVGLQGDHWAAGCSAKLQDGVGSEWQKQFQSHVGADAMLRRGAWILSGEAIYDEYGFRRPGFNPGNITWERSLYGRDTNLRNGVPLSAVGYYVDLGYHGDRWYFAANYGENHPVQIGDDLHDQVIRRWIFKTAYSFTPNCQWYLMSLNESDGFPAQANRDRLGSAFLTGVQARF